MMWRREEPRSSRVACKEKCRGRGIPQLFSIKHHREIVIGGLRIANLKSHGCARMNAIPECETSMFRVDREHRANQVIASAASRLGAVDCESDEKTLTDARTVCIGERCHHFLNGVDGANSVQCEHGIAVSRRDDEFIADGTATLTDQTRNLDVTENREPHDSTVRNPAINTEHVEPGVGRATRNPTIDAASLWPRRSVDCSTCFTGVDRVGIGKENGGAMFESATTRPLVRWQAHALPNETFAPNGGRAVLEIEPKWACDDARCGKCEHCEAGRLFDLAATAYSAFDSCRKEVRGVKFTPEKVEGLSEQGAVVETCEDKQNVGSG